MARTKRASMVTGPERRELVQNRLRSRLSQSFIAKRAGCCLSSVSRFERGERLRPGTEYALAETYHNIASLGLPNENQMGLTGAWLNRQMETFLRTESPYIIEKDAKRYYLIDSEKLMQYSQNLLVTAGKKTSA